MAESRSASSQIRQLARYEVRPDALERCLAAIDEFVAHVRAVQLAARGEIPRHDRRPR